MKKGLIRLLFLICLASFTLSFSFERVVSAPVEKQRLAYVVETKEGWEWYTVCSDGSNKSPGLSGGINKRKDWSCDFSWSPDGNKVMLTVFPEQETGRIITVNPDGTGLQYLTDKTANCRQPLWAPNGKSIAYIRLTGAAGQIWIMNPDGTGKKQMAETDQDCRLLSWSPDSQMICISNIAGTSIITLDSSVCKLLTEKAATEAAWLPNNRELILTASGLFKVDVTNGQVQQIPPLTDPDNSLPADLDTCPSLSSDGKKVVFASQRDLYNEYQGHPTQIFIMNTDGTGLTKLSPEDELEDFPKWAIDDTKIIYWSYTRNEIMSINPDGTDRKKIVKPNDYIFSFGCSADGTMVSYTESVGGRKVLRVAYTDGSGSIDLDEGKSFITGGKWSPIRK